MNRPDAARELHRLTSYRSGFVSPDDPRKLRAWAGPMREPRPPQLKRYPGVATIPLPREPPLARGPAAAILSGTAAPAEEPLDAGVLSRLLFYSAGVVRYIERDGGRMLFRAAGSAGNLFPLELYLVTADVAGVPAGVHHYDALEHGLTPLRSGDHRALLAEALALSRTARAFIVVTGIPWRTGWKYRERGFRHIYWDAGTMLGQLLPLADTGVATSPTLYTGFVDDAVGELVGADGVDEVTALVVALGPADGPPPAAPPLRPLPNGLLADDPKRFRLITEAQHAGDLASAADVTAWRAAATRDALGAAAGVAPQLVPHAELGLEEVVRRRGSTRRFRRAMAPASALSWALAAAARAVVTDFVAPGRSWIDHDVFVHDVEGTDPGVYRFAAGAMRLIRRGDAREAALRLCCDQALASDGAFTVFHSTDVGAITASLGSRGYRVGLLEAGIAEGRLHLSAGLLGLGASGLTFFDVETKAYLGGAGEVLDPMLVTAVGTPAYRPRRGGTPGRPARLRDIPAPAIRFAA
ncbi:MAG TPA: SagB family peptide dehydrogenase [Candidatus Limnocylindria bacterium]